MRLHSIGIVVALICGGCGKLGVDEPKPAAIDAVSATPPSTSVLVGDTVIVPLTISAPTAAVIDSIVVTSSNPAVASGVPDVAQRRVRVITRSAGDAAIAVSVFASGAALTRTSRSASFALTSVAAPAACSVALPSPARSTLWLGESIQLAPVVTTANASVQVSNPGYVSQTPTVLAVNAAGTVQATATGTSEIVYAITCAGPRTTTVRAEARLTLVATNEVVQLSAALDSAKIGRTKVASATVSNIRAGGSNRVTFVSRAPGIATIDSTGAWRAVSSGSTWLVARSTGPIPAQDSMRVLVSDGCTWVQQIAVGQAVSGDLTDGGPCSAYEEFELRLPTQAQFSLNVTPRVGQVFASYGPDQDAGWATFAAGGVPVANEMVLPAGTHRFRMYRSSTGLASYTVSWTPLTKVSCVVLTLRGVSFTAEPPSSCDRSSVYLLGSQAVGTRTELRVTSPGFAPRLRIYVWNPNLTTVADVLGVAGVQATASWVSAVEASMHVDIIKPSAALTTPFSITILPP